MEFLLLISGVIILYQVIKTGATLSSSGNGIRATITANNLVAQKRYLDDDDDDLATFSILFGYDEEKSKNNTPGRWIKPGESITVNGQVFSNGNFYFGGKLSTLSGYGTESSLVDDSLMIESCPSNYEDESVDYWPKFASFTPEGRGAYISWLAGNRSDPDTPLGYVYLYFYGLERRITVDSIKQSVDDAEFRTIFDEIVRLKSIYGDIFSFSNYSTRLLEIMCLLRHHVVSSSELEKSSRENFLFFRHQLACTVNEGKPVPAELALAWLRFYPNYNLKQPARRCADEFGQMFRRRYSKKYGDGIVVKPDKTRLKLPYYPASPSLRGILIPQQDLPDPCFLTGPVDKLIAVAEECTTELGAYSRYLGKRDTSRTDIEALLLLPDELDDLAATLGLKEFRKWADGAISTNNGLVNFDEYWTYTKLPLPAKVNNREAGIIQRLAEKAGYGVAPDTRYHYAKTSVDGKLVLYPERHGKFFVPSAAFYEMGTALRLGAMVAAVDKHIDQAEIDLLSQLIDRDHSLSPVEKRSLHAYLVWRLNSPSNAVGLKTRVVRFGQTTKATVRRLLVNVAMADGKIDPEEIKQLEKLYTMLGLDKALVTGDIHGLSSSRAGVRPARPETARPEKAGPEKEGTASAAASFRLDESILAIHESETRAVQSMLGEIFVEDEAANGSDKTDPEIDTVAGGSGTDGPEIDGPEIDGPGIDGQHYALFQSLTRKDRWSWQEVEALSRNLGLMPKGALETINDWSFEKVDASVFEEDGDAICVDQEIVEEIVQGIVEGIEG